MLRTLAAGVSTSVGVPSASSNVIWWPSRLHSLRFVPHHSPASPEDAAALSQFIGACRHLLVLTGAGVSTESGIPDYRSRDMGLYTRSTSGSGGPGPVRHQEFVGSVVARRRYWARNYVAWPAFSARRPNATHGALARLWRDGAVAHVVTQNVDALHGKALIGFTEGATTTPDEEFPTFQHAGVTELHGSTHRVECLQCGDITPRHELQRRIAADNVGWSGNDAAGAIAPDGDVTLTDEQVRGFSPPLCHHCGGVLKPQVVFFGDNVPKTRARGIFERMDTACDGLLCLGTSLHVYSAYRFVLHAHKLNIPVGIVNIGDTRADDIATLRLWTRCGDLFSQFHRNCLRR